VNLSGVCEPSYKRASLIHFVRVADVKLASRLRREKGMNTMFDFSEICHSTAIETPIDFSEKVQICI
jgi:hypothetical protein